MLKYNLFLFHNIDSKSINEIRYFVDEITRRTKSQNCLHFGDFCPENMVYS